MNSPTEYKKQPVESVDTNIFAFIPFFSHISSVLFATLAIIFLAIVFPWKGGLVPPWFSIVYYLTVAASIYSFYHGYSAIFRRGLSNWDMWAWSVAVLVSIGVTIDIVIFGSIIARTPLIFPGSDILVSPPAFLTFVAFQALYFLVQSILVSLTNREVRRGVENWYLSIYLFMLSMNTASVIIGLLILWYLNIS